MLDGLFALCTLMRVQVPPAPVKQVPSPSAHKRGVGQCRGAGRRDVSLPRLSMLKQLPPPPPLKSKKLQAPTWTSSFPHVWVCFVPAGCFNDSRPSLWTFEACGIERCGKL